MSVYYVESLCFGSYRYMNVKSLGEENACSENITMGYFIWIMVKFRCQVRETIFV